MGKKKTHYNEKKKPHYDLSHIKELLSDESTRIITPTAQKNAASLGYMDVDAILEVIYRLNRKHFYKSMTAHYNPRLWQDVYKIEDKEKDVKLYIKLQLGSDNNTAVVIQFKEDEGGR